MPLCDKCKKFLPPQFVKKVEGGRYLCIFCEKGINKMEYSPLKSKVATKDSIVEEYKRFLRTIRQDSNVLKKTVKGENNESRIIIP